MLRSVGRIVVLTALPALAVVAVSACSTVPEPAADQTTSSVLSSRGVEAPDPVCDRTGPATVGEATRCTVNIDGQQLDVTSRVTGTGGDGPEVDVQSTGRPLPRAELAKRISEDSERRTVCDGDLTPEPGATVGCTVDGGGRVTVTATDVTPDGIIHFTYQ